MGDTNEKNYTLTQEYIDAIKKRLDELKGKELKSDENIFNGINSAGGSSSWEIGGTYNTYDTK